MRAVEAGPLARLLAAHPVLGALPAAKLDELSRRARAEDFAAGQVVVREGEPGDRLFLILVGRAEATTAGSNGPVPLAVLGPGDIMGEVALFSDTGRRQATVTALSELRTASIDYGAFADLLAAYPEVKAALCEAARRQLIARFLKRASPFATLTIAQINELAAKLKHRAFGPGEDIVRQSEEDNACYLILSGKVEVRLKTAVGGERVLTALGPGALVGQAALLTQAPHSATVRAAEPCEVLALQRDDFLNVVRSDAELGRRMIELVQLRARPRRAEHVTAHIRETPEGNAIITLKDERRLAYYRLSPEGWFLWQRLDGDRTLKDLTLDYLYEYKAFAPDRVAAILAGLVRAGFIVGPAFRRELLGAMGAGEGRATALATGRRDLLDWRVTLLDWRVTLRNVDGFFGRLYDLGGWLLFTPTARVVMAALAVAGMASFIFLTGRAADGLRSSDAAVLLLLYPAMIVSTILHEFGHALATKAAGRCVNGVGVGWYWFGPTVFIDTSDMWLSDRRSRITVSLAGPAVNLVLGSVAAIAGTCLSGLALLAAWQFAFASYLVVVVNLNPLLEYDGYHVLVDLLDWPGLRRQAFSWLGRSLPGALWSRVAWRRHAVELVYGLSSLTYIVVMTSLTAWLIRTFLEARLAPVLSPTATLVLAWIAALLFALTALAGLWRDLRSADAYDGQNPGVQAWAERSLRGRAGKSRHL